MHATLSFYSKNSIILLKLRNFRLIGASSLVLGLVGSFGFTALAQMPTSATLMGQFSPEARDAWQPRSETAALLSEKEMASLILKKIDRQQPEVLPLLSKFLIQYPNSAYTVELKTKAAHYFYQNKDYRQVCFLLEDIKRTSRHLSPQEEALRFQLVYSLFQIKRYQEVIQIATEMRQHCKIHCPDFAYYLGSAYYQQGQYQLAAETIKEAKNNAIYAHSVNDLVLSSLFYAQDENQLVQMVKDFDQNRESFDKTYYLLAAHILFKAKRWAEAKKWYQTYYKKLHQTEAQKREIAFLLAYCALQDQEKQQARSYLQEVIREEVIDSLTQHSYYYLGLLYQQEEEREQALKMYRKAYYLELAPEQNSLLCKEMSLYQIIGIYRLLGNYREVKQVASEYCQVFPTGLYWGNVKEAWYEAFFKEDETLALKTLQREVVLYPELQQLLQQYLNFLGNKAYNQQLYTQALGYYELLEREPLQEPSRSELYFKMGVAYFMQGEPESMEKSNFYFHKINVPFYKDYSHYYLGLQAFNEKDYPRAIECLSRCLSSTILDNPFIKAEAELLYADAQATRVLEKPELLHTIERHYKNVIDIAEMKVKGEQGQELQATAYLHWGVLLYSLGKDREARINYEYVARNFIKTAAGVEALLKYLSLSRDLDVSNPTLAAQKEAAIRFATDFISTNSHHPRILEVVMARLELCYSMNQEWYDNLVCEDVFYILKHSRPKDKLYEDALKYREQLEVQGVKCDKNYDVTSILAEKEKLLVDSYPDSETEASAYQNKYQQLLGLYEKNKDDFILQARNFVDFYGKIDEPNWHIRLLLINLWLQRGEFNLAQNYWKAFENQSPSDALLSYHNHIEGLQAYHKGFFASGIKKLLNQRQNYADERNSIWQQEASLHGLRFLVKLYNSTKDYESMLEYLRLLEKSIGESDPFVVLYKMQYEMKKEDKLDPNFVDKIQNILQNADNSPYLADIYDIAFEMLAENGFQDPISDFATKKISAPDRNLRVLSLMWLFKIRTEQGHVEDLPQKYAQLLKSESLSEREKQWIEEVRKSE